MSEGLQQIEAQVKQDRLLVDKVRSEVGKVLFGQDVLLNRLLIGVLTGGHLLLEGVPGLAKTLAIKSLASACDVSFKRIQFTPDLLPADVVGTHIYNPKDQVFMPKLGPVFSNFVLADEINRAPAKVQSALLEVMAEQQVTLGDTTYPIDAPFLVLATQNPIDQEGTYALPEAQVDRFMMKVCVSYPSKADERQMLDRMVSAGDMPTVSPVLSGDDIKRMRVLVDRIYVDEKIKDYVLDIVQGSRDLSKINLAEMASFVAYGASPRASIFLIRAAKGHAFLMGRAYVTPDDVKAVAKDVLRHRVLPTFEAEAQSVDSDAILDRIFAEVVVP